jgi:hypothetical protein
LSVNLGSVVICLGAGIAFDSDCRRVMGRSCYLGLLFMGLSGKTKVN